MTCSWDFSRAEEKEQEVRAAKAARGRARQQKAEKHSQRLNQQREKAAMTLARLTALQDSDAETPEQSNNDGSDVSASLQSSAVDSHEASDRHVLDCPSQMHDHQDLEHVASHHSETRHESSIERHTDNNTEQGSHLSAARSLPIAISRSAKPTLQQGCRRDNDSISQSLQTECGPLRRLGSVAGYPARQMTVPGPLLHSCAVESRRNSPSSMQSWQIVRPRPVQSDKAPVRRPSHVKVQA